MWTPGGVFENSPFAGDSGPHGDPLSDLPKQKLEVASTLESPDPRGRITEAYLPLPRLSIGKTVFSSDYEAWEARLPCPCAPDAPRSQTSRKRWISLRVPTDTRTAWLKPYASMGRMITPSRRNAW